ncbi:MAG: hypothetical protein AAF677_16925 [Pseudomonadota bacterium]
MAKHRGAARRMAAWTVGVAALLAGCTTSVVPVGNAAVDDGYTRSSAIFSTGTSVHFAVASRQEAGKLTLCGAWSVHHNTARATQYIDEAIESGQVQIDGRTVMRDPRRFMLLRENAPLDGSQAACLRTETAWQPVFAEAEPRLRFVRQVFDRSADEITGGDNGVVFRELRKPPPFAFAD